MLALGGHHRLRASMKVRAEQRDRERKHEEYKRELHEAVAARTLPAVPPAAHAPHAPRPSNSSSHAHTPAGGASHAASAKHAAPAAPRALDALEASVTRVFDEANGESNHTERARLRKVAAYASFHWISLTKESSDASKTAEIAKMAESQ